MVTNKDGDSILIPDVLPMLPVRDLVVFPSMIIPLFVGRETSILGVEDSLNHHERLILLACQKDMNDEQPSPEGIYTVGTVGMIMRMRKIPDGRVKILVHGLAKASIKSFKKTHPYYEAEIQKIENTRVLEYSEVEALIRTIREQLEKIINLGRVLSPDILMILEEVYDPSRLADLIAANLGLKVVDSQDLLETLDPFERLNKINDYLIKEIEVLSLQAKIRAQAKDEINKSQKEYFLREQMRAIRTELGDSDPKSEEITELKQKVIQSGMPEEVEIEALKNISRLERMHPESSEASMLRTYVDWLIETPWGKHTKDHLDLHEAKKILDQDHHNLIKIKDRILEHIAVQKLKEKIKGPLLCFAGPPGVGKTSLGKSIAKALGRKFIRISLGGLKDEAEIRGHRRTYVGAMPGRIIQGLKQAGSNNPVFILDEIDKLGSDFKGDPSSAFLEVLDPEQNHAFRDHYLNLPFDLSNVMFIATCNVLENIPPALRDRMEVIQLSGYTEEEKLIIAKKYLIQKQMLENGISEDILNISDESVLSLILNYTREAGLRTLERSIGSVCRKVARKLAEGNKEKVFVNNAVLEVLLGPPLYVQEDFLKRMIPGVVAGLAWTAVGGEVLFVEVSTAPGKGGLILTGQLGDVMKESAQTALGYIRAHATELGILDKAFLEQDIHVHFPAGAVPKDGPSAGITIAVALVSRLTNLQVTKDLAMTGEISLIGKVLPIGGLKEKALAAVRYGIKKVLIPLRNTKDLEDVPQECKDKLEFIVVETIDDVLRESFVHDVGLIPSTKKKRKTTTKSLLGVA